MNLIKFSKQKITFESFLCGVPARDYIYQDTAYDEQIKIAAAMIHNAEYVLIGAGAGMSTAAGAQYGGKFFEEFHQMDQARCDCKIPTDMVPKCPVCGGPMDMNLRKDNFFVQDDAWYKAEKRFSDYLSEAIDKKLVLLELGVGFNTPTIIRFPFENMVRKNSNLSLIRLNLNEAVVPESFGNRAIGINADMASSVSDICHELEKKAGVSNERK